MINKLGKIIIALSIVFIVSLIISSNITAQDPPTINGEIGQNEYTNHYETDINMDFYWSFDEENIYIGLTSPGSGWLAVGFEPTLRMRDAAIIIAHIENEELQIESHIGSAPTAHTEIENSYIINASGTNTSDGNIIEFSIPLNDNELDIELNENETYTLIFAYHNTEISFSRRHSARTSTEIEF